MPIRFLDEETNAAPSRVRFLDEPASPAKPRLRLLEESTPAKPAEIVSAIDSDPTRMPGLEEFKAYRSAKATQSWWPGAGKLVKAFGAGVAGVGKALGDIAAGTAQVVSEHPQLGDLAQSAAEGLARGTVDLGLTFRPLAEKIEALGTDMTQDEFFRRKAATEGKPLKVIPVPTGSAPVTVRPDKIPDAWKKEFEDYKLSRDYERFKATRLTQQVREAARNGQGNLLPEWLGTTNQRLAEGASLFDLTDLASFAAGKIFAGSKAGARAGRAATGAITQTLGETAEEAGEFAAKAGNVIPSGVGRVVGAVSGDPEMAERALKATAAAQTTGAVGGLAGVSVPGVSETLAAAEAVKRGGQALGKAGTAARVVGRAISEGPSVLGPLERIAADRAAPLWMKKIAQAALPLDPVLRETGAAAGAATRGAVGGALVGGTIAGVGSLGNLETMAGGAGSGATLGAAGGISSTITGFRARQAAGEDNFLRNWFASKTGDEVSRIVDLGLSRTDALKMALAENAARGTTGRGDVTFNYLTDAEFKAKHGGSARGAHLIMGETPVVDINTGYAGTRTVFHEIGHALDALDVDAGARGQLNRTLFGLRDGAGNELVPGAFSEAHLRSFQDSYVSRLFDAEKARWRNREATPEGRAENRRLIEQEVRAEVFANLVEGAPYRLLTARNLGLTSRVVDALTLADKNSMLGRMRRALATAGVRFNEDGTVSDVLKGPDGEGLVNTPEVNAAMRQYLRARQRVLEPLTAAEEAPGSTTIIRPSDLTAKGAEALVRAFGDSDIFQRDAAGSIVYSGGRPVLLDEASIRRLQAKRAGLMHDALAAVPDAGDVNAMKPNMGTDKKPYYYGKYFSDAQMAAILALPADTLAPSLKTKLIELNNFAKAQDGRPVVIDYNAALAPNRKYSSAISSQMRLGVPIAFKISKAGNFLMDTVDITHFDSKLRAWEQGRSKFFEPWSGDTDAFLNDVRTYLNNHVAGRPGHIDLSPDAATALDKRNRINEFFGFPGREDVNPLRENSGQKDNLIRSRRFDRINRILPGAGDPWPIRYDLQKRNYLPSDFGAGRGDVKMLRREKEAWIAAGRPLAGAQELVARYYEPGNYQHIAGEDAIYVPMPSTSGANIIPQEFAYRLAKDFGGLPFAPPVAVPAAIKEAKHKTGWQAKLDDPVEFVLIPENAAALRDAAAGRRIILIDDVHNTGESQLALERTLGQEGLPVDGRAVLAASEIRRTSPRDIARLSERLSAATGLALDEIKPVVENRFNGTFKQWFNYFERGASRSSRDAVQVWERLRTGKPGTAFGPALPGATGSFRELESPRQGQDDRLGPPGNPRFLPAPPISRPGDLAEGQSVAIRTRFGPGQLTAGVQFLPAYHGTPHEVDKFSLSKIGTGEGAQVYGWGLYFAENPEVAKAYADQLGNRLVVKGKMAPRRSELGSVHAAVDALGTLEYVLGSKKAGSFSLADHAPMVERAVNRLETSKAESSPGSFAHEAVSKVLDWWWSIDGGAVDPSEIEYRRGKEYTVDLKVQPDELLDWDKPLSEQSKKVKKALSDIGQLARENFGTDPTGEQIYNYATHSNGRSAARTSAMLAADGIRGIRYLDQGSRGKSFKEAKAGLERAEAYLKRLIDGGIQGDLLRHAQDAVNRAKAELKIASNPTYNYVIFDESAIEITHKNGEPVKKAGASFLPAPQKLISATRAQAGVDLARALGVPENTGALLAGHYIDAVRRAGRAPVTASTRAAALALTTLPAPELEALSTALRTRGLNEVKDHMKSLAERPPK